MKIIILGLCFLMLGSVCYGATRQEVLNTFLWFRDNARHHVTGFRGITSKVAAELTKAYYISQTK